MGAVVSVADETLLGRAEGAVCGVDISEYTTLMR